jgi:DTW domain-containing protein
MAGGKVGRWRFCGVGEVRVDRAEFAAPDGGIMARSVVLRGTAKCPRCQVAPRWCVCAGLATVSSPLAVDVLMHHREQWRPSSTGHLIARVVAGARVHEFRREAPPQREAILRPEREVWVLHPLGEPAPSDVRPEQLQILLLDGSWGEAAEMKKAVEGWGRRVSLPMMGESRYWLRAQQGPGQFSTAEALLFVMTALGLTEAQAALRVQLELHVYAGLLSRGRKIEAANYLLHSPLAKACPEVLRALEPR